LDALRYFLQGDWRRHELQVQQTVFCSALMSPLFCLGLQEYIFGALVKGLERPCLAGLSRGGLGLADSARRKKPQAARASGCAVIQKDMAVSHVKKCRYFFPLQMA